MTNAVVTIERKDLIPFSTYTQGRDEYIRKMIAYKNARRVRLDQNISLLFENRQTVFFQIQELVFSEDLTDAAEIDEYISIYSAMLPNTNELSATLFIEIDNQPLLEEFLIKLKGIEHALFMKIGDEIIQAVFEEEHDEREFTTSVHYIKFPLSKSAQSLMTSKSAEDFPLLIILDHPALHSEVLLTAEAVASLQTDLSY